VLQGLGQETADKEPGIKRVTQKVLELDLDEADCSALVGAIPNIHPRSMVKKVALLFELWWMEAVMWLMRKSQEAATAKSMKLR
jgi:hypothetical protein